MRQRHRPFFILIFSIFFQFKLLNASYCGINGVPYSLEILSDGSPVLGCAQPTCISDPIEEDEDSVFIANAAGQEDGFFREGDRQRRTFTQSYKPSAECPGTFSDLACTKKNQWVGGIDFIDHPRQPLILQCCTFEGLRFSQDVGVTTISAGEAVTGGEVVREGRQISFDVIANVRRLVDPDDPKRTYFEVTVRRMNCLPDPPEFEVAYDDDVEMEIARVLGNATNSAMNLGRDGQSHLTHGKVSKRPYKRKPKTSSTQNVISPLAGHEETEKRGRSEHFIGSFGAPIFNPTAEKNEASWSSTLPPRRNTIPYTRRILTPKPRVQTTTPAPTTPLTAVPVQIQVEQVLATPSPLPNPFNFQPLPPFPTFGISHPGAALGGFTGFAPPAPPPPSPVQHHQLFGLPQTGPLAPAPLIGTHQSFGLFGPQPPASAPGYNGLSPSTGYGLQLPENALNNLDSYTRSLLTNPSSPFSLQMQPQNYVAPPSPQFLMPLAPPSQPTFDQYTNQNQNLQRINIQAPRRETGPVIYQADSETDKSQNFVPQQNLAPIYRPPPFAALGTTLYNFQTHNGK